MCVFITVPIMGSVLFPNNDTTHQLFTRSERHLLCLINTIVANQKPPTVFPFIVGKNAIQTIRLLKDRAYTVWALQKISKWTFSNSIFVRSKGLRDNCC